jgi:glutathione S-transferase
MLNINLSGRVPFLLLDDGTGIEDTPVLVQFLDSLKAPVIFDHGIGRFDLNYLRLEAMTRSLLDGVSVWLREIRRPSNEQSPTILLHEQARSTRLVSYFNEISAELHLNGSLNLAQLYLFVALDLERQIPSFKWRTQNSNLVKWYDKIETQPSVRSSWQDIRTGK